MPKVKSNILPFNVLGKKPNLVLFNVSSLLDEVEEEEEELKTSSIGFCQTPQQEQEARNVSQMPFMSYLVKKPFSANGLNRHPDSI